MDFASPKKMKLGLTSFFHEAAKRVIHPFFSLNNLMKLWGYYPPLPLKKVSFSFSSHLLSQTSLLPPSRCSHLKTKPTRSARRVRANLGAMVAGFSTTVVAIDMAAHILPTTHMGIHATSHGEVEGFSLRPTPA
jgi:hypothetical protein